MRMARTAVSEARYLIEEDLDAVEIEATRNPDSKRLKLNKMFHDKGIKVVAVVSSGQLFLFNLQKFLDE
jgi:hypothetical protein